MHRRLTHNWSLKLTALVLAVALWSHVRGQVNPWEVASFKVHLTAEAPVGYVLQGSSTLPEHVTILLRGPRLTLRQFKGSAPANPLAATEDAPLLTTRRVRAFLDFSSPHPGEQKAAVKVETSIEDVEFVGAKPGEVEVTLDVASQKKVAVETVIDLPSSWRATNWQTDVDSVRVSGPSQTLERVVATRARVESKATSSGTINFGRVPLVAIDEDGDEVKGVLLEPNSVRVRATVTERLDEKNVPLKVRLSGDAARGYEIGNIEVEPSTVTLRAPRRVLEGINSVSVDMKIESPRADVSQRVRLQAPARTEIVSASRVRVRVRVSPTPQVETPPKRIESTPDTDAADSGTLSPPAPMEKSSLPQPAPATP